MNEFSDKYEPSPEFLARLDRDIDREFRSERLFGPPPARQSPRRLFMVFGIAAGVVLTLLTGVVLGASASYAAAATPSAPRSAFAILPIKDVVNAIACAPAKTAPQTTQDTRRAQQRVPIVELSSPTASTAETFGAVLGVREGADGRLLVNDAGRYLMRLFEPNFAASKVVLDSLPGSAQSYGFWPSPLIPFTADSSLFHDDRVAGQMLVLDGHGQIVRALPAGKMGLLEQARFTDGKGRVFTRFAGGVARLVAIPLSGLIARPQMPGRPGGSISGRGGGDPGAPTKLMSITNRSDSLPIVRIDLDSRRVDTVEYLIEPQDSRSVAAPNGGGKTVLVYGRSGAVESMKQVINPLYAIDEWAVLSDGTIAVVRGHDYHVDWTHSDGTRTASPKLPYEWKQLTDGDKQRLIDSTRRVVDSLDALALANFLNPPARDSNTKLNCPRGCPITDAERARIGPNFRQFPYEIVPLSQIADYWPPIRKGAALPDRDGNLWILPRATSLSKNGELIYDVVNPKQGLVRRVRLPAGRAIAGFGKGGVVYLQAGDIKNGFTLERTIVPGTKPPPK
jgi:hypothetical protein